MTSSDCGLRCYTERKSYCKDLHKWGKNLLYMIENSNPVDWRPADFCPVCSGRRFSAMEEVSQEKEEEEKKVKTETEEQNEVPSSDNSESSASTHPKLNFDFLFSNNTETPADLSAANITAPIFTNPFSFFGFGSPTYLHQLLQWSSILNPAFYTSPQAFMPLLANSFDLHQNQNGLQLSSSSACGGGEGNDCRINSSKFVTNAGTSGGDQPLDLSQKSRSSTSRSCRSDATKFQAATAAGVGDFLAKGLPGFGKCPSGSMVAANGVSSASSNGNGSSGTKRNYTQLDLEAAVKDIRSGRLGTRRASVVYGIPRSTLRNKIYKLEAAEESGLSVAPVKRPRRLGVAISSSPLDNSNPASQEEEPTASSEKTVPQCFDTGTFSSAPEIKSEKKVNSEDSFKDSVVEMLAKSQAARVSEELPAINLRWSAFGLLPPASAEEWYRSPAVSAAVSAASQEALKQCWTENWAEESTKTLMKEYKQQFQANIAEERKTETPASGSGSESPVHRKSAGKEGGESWKKSRPKRGQYRKYDKNALDEAVRSVRRGEMSVHRAGSYYGVPHSTLEYKVKERNLLRPKKKDAKRLMIADGGVEEKEERKSHSASPKKSSRKGGGDVSPLSKEILEYLQEGKDQAESLLNGKSKSVSTSPVADHNVSVGECQQNFFPPAPFAYGSTGICTSEQPFFASDMMRRLQAEAVTKDQQLGSVGQESRCSTQ